MQNIENDRWFLSLVRSGTLIVGKDGTVFNTKTNRFIGAVGSGGYPKISVSRGKGDDGKHVISHMQIHRLVWMAFNGEIPLGVQINHKDLNKSNPSLDNLELLTPSENTKHAMENGRLNETLFKKGNVEWKKSPHIKLATLRGTDPRSSA